MIPLCRLKCVTWLSALLCCLLLVICARPAQAEENYIVTGSELQQLSAIFEKLETLNQKLSGELATSKESLHLLEDELLKLKADLAGLQTTLAQSEMVSTQLRELLQKAENSLTQLEASFEEFKSAAQSQIRKLRRQRNLAILAAIIVAFI